VGDKLVDPAAGVQEPVCELVFAKPVGGLVDPKPVGVELLSAVEPVGGLVDPKPVGGLVDPKPVGGLVLQAEPVGELVLRAAVKIDKKEEKLQVAQRVAQDKVEEKREAAQRAQQDKAEEKREADHREAQEKAYAKSEYNRKIDAEEKYEAMCEQRDRDDAENAKDKTQNPWKVVQTIPGRCPYQRRDGTPCWEPEACHYHMFTMRNLNLPCSGLRESGQRCFNGMPCNKHLLPGMKGFVPGPPGSYGDF
jgi:hypothetical protein